MSTELSRSARDFTGRHTLSEMSWSRSVGHPFNGRQMPCGRDALEHIQHLLGELVELGFRERLVPLANSGSGIGA